MAAVAGLIATPLIVVVYGWMATQLLDRDREAWARHDAAYAMARSLYAAVDLYRRDHQRVPDDQEGLAALVPKYARTIPLDPWGQPFVYRSQGGDWADVISLGGDGEAGGVGIATDVSARYGSPGTTPSRSLVDALVFLMIAIPAACYAISFWGDGGRVALAGNAAFWAWVTAATVGPNAEISTALVGALAAIAAALSGAVMSLRGLRGGPTTALLGALGCLVASAAMVG